MINTLENLQISSKVLFNSFVAFLIICVVCLIVMMLVELWNVRTEEQTKIINERINHILLFVMAILITYLLPTIMSNIDHLFDVVYWADLCERVFF